MRVCMSCCGAASHTAPTGTEPRLPATPPGERSRTAAAPPAPADEPLPLEPTCGGLASAPPQPACRSAAPGSAPISAPGSAPGSAPECAPGSAARGQPAASLAGSPVGRRAARRDGGASGLSPRWLACRTELRRPSAVPGAASGAPPHAQAHEEPCGSSGALATSDARRVGERGGGHRAVGDCGSWAATREARRGAHPTRRESMLEAWTPARGACRGLDSCVSRLEPCSSTQPGLEADPCSMREAGLPCIALCM
eukprot:scaffold49150_cov71-Phaeocystis_antarctica.AAC.2